MTDQDQILVFLRFGQFGTAAGVDYLKGEEVVRLLDGMSGWPSPSWSVIAFPNGNVLVFGKTGDQIPWAQGVLSALWRIFRGR